MKTAQRTRLDTLLVERGLAETAERARGLIAAGLIEVEGVRAQSAAAVDSAVRLRIIGRTHEWASRGGLKLDAALTRFAVAVGGRVCLDAGASTGGFTDVLLSHGASLVYAVDVGRGQLDPRLSGDPRVRVMDRTNLRTLVALDGPPPTLVTLDLSFISLRAVLPAVSRVAPGAEVVALFKPQFELARDEVGRGGVVRDAQLLLLRLQEFQGWATAHLGATVLGDAVAAQVRGAKGNQEWLVHLRMPEAGP